MTEYSFCEIPRIPEIDVSAKKKGGLDEPKGKREKHSEEASEEHASEFRISVLRRAFPDQLGSKYQCTQRRRHYTR
eukprot:g33453.t1